MLIGVARPTRGLEFSESSQSIDDNCAVVKARHVTRRSWDKGIPDCFNELVDLLLRSYKADYIWIVEEDIVVPPGGLKAMMDEDADIAALEYPLKLQDGAPSSLRDKNGKLVWTSTGCMLVKRQVFDALEPPWFRSQYTVGSVHEGSSCKEKKLKLLETDYPYGGHDVYFTWMAREAGFKIAIVEGMTADHLDLDALGVRGTNAGCHSIIRIKPRSDFDARNTAATL